jgi:transposase
VDQKAKLLDTLPGVAPYTALFLSSALDDVDRFPDSRHACAYLGLVPSVYQTGDVSVTGHITRDGNKFLRRNLVECARVAVRKDPYLKGFYLKLRRVSWNAGRLATRRVVFQIFARKIMLLITDPAGSNAAHEPLSTSDDRPVQNQTHREQRCRSRRFMVEGLSRSHRCSLDYS